MKKNFLEPIFSNGKWRIGKLFLMPRKPSVSHTKYRFLKCRIALLVMCSLVAIQSYAYAQDATTTAKVRFVKGEGPTAPVNPDEPEIPENGGEEQDGALAIVKVSDFDFDSVEIAPGNQSYDIVTYKPNIQVVDLRGTGEGWKVSASLSEFSSADKPSLPGASIIFERGRHNSISISPPPVQENNLELTSDGEPLPIITAEKGAGTGLWIMRWYPESGIGMAYITLNIPSGSATLGIHNAEINWILEDTPSAP